jgi:CMP-N,N'-diacetyllegionaminic acid synthase
MFGNKKVLALITARGGSKGIPRKNIRLLGNKPLICWTIEAANKSKYIDRLILSSDDDEIISIARQSQCNVPFVRPRELALDNTPSMNVILHALDAIDSQNYDYLLLLQPTSPFRTGRHIDAMIESCVTGQSEIMVSITKLRKHPSFMYELKDGFLSTFLGTETHVTRRQDMPPAYEHNGAMYMANIDILKMRKNFNTDKTAGFIMNEIDGLDIDEEQDWQYAECVINQRRE